MPALPTYDSRSNLRAPQRVDAGAPFRQIADTAVRLGQQSAERETQQADFDTKMQLVEQQNQAAEAKINFKVGLAELEQERAASPFDMPPDIYEERKAKLSDETQSGIDSLNALEKFKLESQIDSTRASIIAQSGYNSAQIDRSKNLTFTAREIWENDPLRNIQELNQLQADNANLYSTEEWDKMRDDSIFNAGSNDGGRSPEAADIELARLADPNDQKYAELDEGQKNTLKNEINNTKKRLTGEMEDAAIGQLLDVWVGRLQSGEPLAVDDVEQFKGMLSDKQRKSFLGIAVSSGRAAVTEGRAATKFEQGQIDYYRGEADRFSKDLELPENRELKDQMAQGELSAQGVKDNPDIPDDAKKQIVPMLEEVERLQKFEKFETTQEVEVARLIADIDKYSKGALITKLATDPYLKSLEGGQKKSILDDHERVPAEGQGFRRDPSWHTANDDLMQFKDDFGFVGGVPDTTDQAVMDRADIENNRRFVNAENNFLQRSEFDYRQQKKDPTGAPPQYYNSMENETAAYREKSQEEGVMKFIKDVTLGSFVDAYGEKKQAEIDAQRIKDFADSPETQAFNAYMEEKSNIAQGLVDRTIGQLPTPQDEFTIDEIKNVNGSDYQYMGNGQWLPLN